MTDLLLEIFSEEIPAGMQQNAAQALQKSVADRIDTELSCTCKTESWATPQRLGVYVTGIPQTQEQTTEKLRGPRTSAPEQALEGFLRKNSLTKEQLSEEGEYYYAEITKGGGEIGNVLQSIIESTLNKFVWPKSMKWGASEIRWVRPIHNILCLHNQKILPVQFGQFTANNKSYGHRFLAPNELQISSYEDYKSKIQNAEVIASFEERKQSILDQISQVISRKNINLIEDNRLLDEVAGLVEKPHVLLGSIEENFMSLPREVLVIALKHHQRYFMLESEDGNLSPYFIIVSNISSSDQGAEIIKGNERVLRARLSDAQFFYDQDKQEKLESRVEYLKKLTFHEKIGSVYDKMQSVISLSDKVAAFFGVSADSLERSITLSKADLVTNMVKEFPELQGVMGYYYAMNDNEDSAVSLAIKEHYKPQGPSDYAPEEPLSAATAVCDKLDTLNQLFAIDIKPTGSKDPFALRRAANGIIRIVGEDRLPEFLEQMSSSDSIRGDVKEFILERKLKA